MKLLASLQYRARQWREDRRFHAALTHLAGPAHFELADDEVCGFVLVHDGAYHLPYLFEWHRARGVDKWIVIDNASNDATREIVAAQPNTILARCDLPYQQYERRLRYLSLKRFARGGWRLILDADELFDYPQSDRLSLSDVVRRANAQGHSAVVAQMLDMFPKGPLAELGDMDFRAAAGRSTHYDLQNIDRYDYAGPKPDIEYWLSHNSVSDPGVQILFGGVRRTVFGETCCLSKHPLVRDVPGARLGWHPHLSPGLRVADYSAVLRHYKFTGDFIGREREVVERLGATNDGPRLRVARYLQEDRLALCQPSSRRLDSVDDLYANGFLYASEPARAFFGLAPGAVLDGAA
ncbi:MAG: glycosyltransferase family 2 protein [Pseudomonadota bacterium]